MAVTRWQQAQDAVLAGVVGAAGLAEVWTPFESVQGDGSPVLSSLAIVLCALVLAVRRRWPIALIGVPAAWLTLGLATLGGVQVLFYGSFVPICIAMYSGARHGDRRTMPAVCGSIAVVVVIGDLTIAELGTLNEILFHWGVLLALFAAGRGMRVSERRAVDAAVRAARAEAEARETALTAVADERARIARELHDIVGHSVSSMVVQAGAASTSTDDPALVGRALESIRTTGADALAEMRSAVASLRGDEGWDLEPVPGVAALPALVEKARADGLAVELVESGPHGALLPGQELAVYRIVQESLTNVRKHAAGAAVTIDVEYRAGGIEVTVTNTGDVAGIVGTGSGLTGMRERAAAHGGSVEAGPIAGGWRVRALVGAP